jgi:hypothetical protein
VVAHEGTALIGWTASTAKRAATAERERRDSRPCCTMGQHRTSGPRTVKTATERGPCQQAELSSATGNGPSMRNAAL